MEIKPEIREALDRLYARVHINDFSSFIKSDFRDDMLFDLSEERAERNDELCRDLLSQTAAWKAQPQTTAEERVIIEVAEDFCRYIMRNSKYYWYKFNLPHNTCPLPYVVKRLETYPLESREALDKYLMLLEQFPDKLTGLLDKLNGQKQRGILLPEEQTGICMALLESLIQPDNSLLCPWNRPEVPVSLSERQQQNVQDVLARFNARLSDMIDYLRQNYYRGSSPGQPGLCHLPGGGDYYQEQIITYTSYRLKPEEIHEIGLRELEKTRGVMLEIIRRLGLDMDIPRFQYYLKAQRICFDNSVEELQARFDRTLNLIRPRLSQYFRRQPQADCRCECLPKSKEATTSWGYYSVPIGQEKQGVFYYSGAELDQRTQMRTAAIVAHELLPGHHFQVNLIAEDSTLPAIHREHFNTAFADGWAEYAADLVNEMGLYDLYELYGRYVWDMVLCCRLVVDTGMNALGWPIEKARDFMRQNTFLTEKEIFTESLRYSVDMPGQALAYKYGCLKMHEQRQKAEQALGAAFDIRDYHEEVLRYGSVPLDILEKNIDALIKTRRTAGQTV